ncbi:phytanoyl-CoA dioxygenase family protein [Fluviicola sp.]|uniref:phytanoyl-CoA dioxygenase family protein n=1 Tax=Fluviicola sp. TaxID=1917219 RepID=UPI0031D02F94
MKNIVKLITFPFLFSFGLFVFLLTKKTTKLGYAAFRYLFVLTNGRVNDHLSAIIRITKKGKTEAANGVLGNLSKKEIEHISAKIVEDGFYEFDVTLDNNLIEEITAFASETGTRYVDVDKKNISYSTEKVIFDRYNPISPRYQFETSDIMQNQAIQSLVFDPTLRSVATSYLKCNPILDTLAMWWSVPFGNKGASQAAQMFHFDMDRFKFIKFFFYITDVHTNNGPHCYIQNSHKGLPKAIRKDGRMTDEELAKIYSKDRFKEFTGKKGTILAVDTRGLHKGKPLTEDVRLLFQIQFSNSLFGAPFEKVKLSEISEDSKGTILKNKRTYQLFSESE